MKKPFLIFLGLCLSQLLASCVVYQPMQCAAPQITDKKQGEISASSYLNGRYELASTYSPMRHLLVRAAYSELRSDTKDSTYYRGHQYDLGVGTYWHAGDKWLLGGLGGFGQAQSAAAFIPGITFNSARREYDARYNKVFGEVYGTLQATDATSLGLAYRVTQVNFTTLTSHGLPIDFSRMTRSEPMFYFRVRLGYGPAENRTVQLQAAWGISDTFGYRPRDLNATYSQEERDLKQGRSYTTLGITVFPHCFFRQKLAIPATY